jgi:hypothetical protein
MNSITDDIKRAKWQKLGRDLPLTTGTIMAVNILPVLIFWKVPGWRTHTMYAVWIGVTTFITAGNTMTIGPVEVRGQMKNFWAPWQICVGAAINLILIAATIVVMNCFVPLP